MYFIVMLQSKDLIECTGPEAYVKTLLEKDDLSWFPQGMAKCLTKTKQNSTERELGDIKGHLKSLQHQVYYIQDMEVLVHGKQKIGITVFIF